MTLFSPRDLGIGRLFELIRDAVIVADIASDRIVLWNPAAARLFGYSADEALGMPVTTIIPERYRDRHTTALEHYRATGHGDLIDAGVPLELPALRKDGSEITVELSLSPIDEPAAGGRFVLAVIRDVTERKRAEDERERRIREQVARAEAEAVQQRLAFVGEATTLLASSLDYETTLQRLADIVALRLADYCVVDIVEESGAVCRVASAHRDPALALLVKRLQDFPPAPDTPDPLHQVLQSGRPVLIAEVGEDFLQQIAVDDEHLALLRALHPTSYLAVPLHARGRTFGAVALVSTDPSRRFGPDDLALAEDLARRAALTVDNAHLYGQAQRALSTRDEFLSSAAHDLKNPLTSIKGLAQLLLRRAARLSPPERERFTEALSSIEAAATKMTQQVNELLDIARLDMGQPLALQRQPTDLVALARQAIAEQQQATERHQLRLEASESSLVGEWDAARLERVLANLLSNAVKYSPQGGEIVVRVRRDEDAAGAWAVLEVQDQGLGIPKADLSYIFERFRRGRNVQGRIAGTGIGLAGVRQIVTQHGGQISVRSQEGMGSTFSMRLPLSPREQAPALPSRNEGAAQAP